ncbi:MAG: methyltransferase [Muribaculaceae bacterium]|nr:methyltransferase [Muribaculaceae bacterium]
MDKKELIFKFKKFNMSHGQSSMRIGVDAVLLGAWCDVRNINNVLDVGTGCGVIALMMAQRLPCGKIKGIDIDIPSVEEARKNFDASPWSERCSVTHIDFQTYVRKQNEIMGDNKDFGRVDLIVSNPPYFDAGITSYNSSRILARHQGPEFSPAILLNEGKRILSDKGKIAVIVPKDVGEKLESEAVQYGMVLLRKCYVRGHEKAPYKRLLMEFGNIKNYNVEIYKDTDSFLTLEISPGLPTEAYRELCKEFYLKF